MKSKLTLKQSLLILGGAGVIILTLFFYGSSQRNIPVAEQAKSVFPVRIKIPIINVDGAVENVGLTPGGAMDVPATPAGVAWYELGPRPGEIGSAVLAGHSGYKNNQPAVFDDLYKLKTGDEILSEDGNGVITIFVVRETKTYNPDAYATEVFISNDGLAHLNLITCVGEWNKEKETHSKRLVVFADKKI